MNIYHSFWEGGYKSMSKTLHDIHELSVLSALKSYGNINLITTKSGLDFLGDLPYTSIELFEKKIPQDYSPFWALSKIFAYEQIITKGLPFFHIDYDVFLFKKLPERFHQAGLVCQEPEDGLHLRPNYDISILKKYCKNKYLFDEITSHLAYNVGIFGGTDMESMMYYVNRVFEIVFDDENKNFFTHNYFNNTLSLSSIIEQYYLSLCMMKKNVEITTLFGFNPDGGTNYDDDVKYGYTHLMSSKNNPKVIEGIRKKILEYK
jgi:hypothetical protein